MKPVRYLLAALLFQIPLVLANSNPASAVLEQLQTGDALHGSFTQEKQLPFLSRPLMSAGVFSITGQGELHWRVNQPVVSEMVVDNAGVTLDGRPMHDRGTAKMIAKLMSAFVRGDLSGLESTFKLASKACERGWFLTLTPRSILVKSVLDTIEVSGGLVLQQLFIVETSGTTTKINFTDVSHGQGSIVATGKNADSP